MAAEGVCAGRESGEAERLIAARLRQGATERPSSSAPFSVERWLAGDAGHIARAGDLAHVPISSHRRLAGRPVVALKRAVRRLLYPLIDVQSGVNAATARVVAFLLEQTAAQALAIEELERQLAELRAEHRR